MREAQSREEQSLAKSSMQGDREAEGEREGEQRAKQEGKSSQRNESWSVTAHLSDCE